MHMHLMVAKRLSVSLVLRRVLHPFACLYAQNQYGLLPLGSLCNELMMCYDTMKNHNTFQNTNK